MPLLCIPTLHFPYITPAISQESQNLDRLSMRRKAERVVPAIEDDELRLEKDISVNLEIAGRRLNTAEASYKEKMVRNLC